MDQIQFAVNPAYTVNLPTEPNAAPTKTVDTSSWTIVYPPYLDAALTSAQGRRLPKAVAVVRPTVQEIAAGLTALKIRHEIERVGECDIRVQRERHEQERREKIMAAVAEAKAKRAAEASA